MSDTVKQTLGFQTEARQLLHLMIHSLYSNREIFLRELISNASDAADKLRFAALKDDSLYENDAALSIKVGFDAEAGTITITDNGIGMSLDDVIDNLGTIAKSGTAEFLKSLTGDQARDSRLIGQFGVGFYSAFIVADRVEVLTRKAGLPASEAVHWESAGEAEFTVETITRENRGTTIILHLKQDAAEFADAWKLRGIVKKYADHISLPVMMEKAQHGDEEQADAAEWEAVNSAKALWTRSRSEVKDEEYQEFYKHVSHDFDDALDWSHNKVEGKLEYTSLLYVPKRAPFDLWNREGARGLKLYVQRVFIMDQAEQFLPLYLRFIRGVVDSNDISLNVSREILQQDPVVDTMKSALTKRVLDMLSKMKQGDKEKYQSFWKEFGQVLKEGPAEDPANKEKIAGLMLFASTHNDGNEQDQGLVDYVGRIKEGQDKIYYIASDSFNAAKNSPHLEAFRKKGIEVLLLTDRVDEWMVSYLQEFDGKQFQDVARGNIDLAAFDSEEEKQQQQAQDEKMQPLLDRISSSLGDRVSEVKATHRLTESPACISVSDQDMGAQMRKLMEAAGQAVPDFKPVFEVNPVHPLIQRLDQEQDEDRFGDLVSVLFDQASLAEGNALEDPGAYISRLNRLLLELN